MLPLNQSVIHKVLFCLSSWMVFTAAYSQTKHLKEDSLFIQTKFTQALQNPYSSDSIIAIAQARAVDSENSGVKDLFEYQKIRFLFLTGKIDSALVLSELRLKTLGISHYVQSAKYFNLIGSIRGIQGDYKAAIDYMLKAKRIYDFYEDEYRSALIENNIANIFFSLKDYQASYKHAFNSYQVLNELNDTLNLPSVCGIVAVSAIKINEIDKGRVFTKRAIRLANEYNNPIALIIANYAKGELNQKFGKWNQAITAYETSKQLSVQFNQSHYTLLSNIALLHAYTETEQFDKAINYGLEALSQSASQKNNNTYYSINKQLGYAYAGQGNYQQAYTYLNEALLAYVETAGIESRQSLNEMLVKYETQKKETEIAKQKVVILEKEKAVDRRNIWIVILLSALVFVSLVFLLIRYSIKRRVEKLRYLQEEKINRTALKAEETERERISNELHDGVAAGITSAKIQLELLADQKDADLQSVLNNLTNLHADVRKISHNLMPVDFEENSLFEVINTYCNNMNGAGVKIQCFNNVKTAVNLDAIPSSIIYRTVQELIQNVLKHANANHCTIQFNTNEQNLILSVEDDGKGFDPNNARGQGLSSINKRIQDIGGDFEIESTDGAGALFLLTIPLNK